MHRSIIPLCSILELGYNTTLSRLQADLCGQRVLFFYVIADRKTIGMVEGVADLLGVAAFTYDLQAPARQVSGADFKCHFCLLSGLSNQWASSDSVSSFK